MRYCERLLLLVILASGLLPVFATNARAGSIGTELWLGGGFSYPDYASGVRACARGGIGVVFKDHLALGVSSQVDRDHYHYFGDISVVLPPVGLSEPYARFQIGRREDVNDTAMGWAAGLRWGEDNLYFFLEANEIFEPEDSFGFTGGIAYRL